jgi:ribA/ribD-fused uncharacterized protein
VSKRISFVDATVVTPDNDIAYEISSFSGDWRFLSNFWPVTVIWEGVEYPSVEHAYQASKTINPMERELVRLAETPGRAKRAGRQVTLRKDWEEVRLAVMTELVTLKFSQEPLRSRLLDTGDAAIAEGNNWGDTFWGINQFNIGRNHLGRILMEVREQLKTEYQGA